MRWLVIALLVFLQVQVPTVAGAASAAASCHAMADDSAPTGQTGQGESDTDRPSHRAHLCPGCSIPGLAPMVERPASLLTTPLFTDQLAALDSIARQPSVPPPRMG
jgi:hypothetical protein